MSIISSMSNDHANFNSLAVPRPTLCNVIARDSRSGLFANFSAFSLSQRVGMEFLTRGSGDPEKPIRGIANIGRYEAARCLAFCRIAKNEAIAERHAAILAISATT